MVAKLRSLIGVREIGRAGTLDPFATGVLVVGFGRALKVVEYVQQLDKVYPRSDHARSDQRHRRRGWQQDSARGRGAAG
ncbi:MAG: hypothetical protein U0514_00620 [Candidatus Andersenbacteria bacterium]